jgi:hypothetical protein
VRLRQARPPAPRLTYLPFPAARGRRRRSPFPTASSPAGRKPPQLARRGLRKPTGRQPLPQQLASRVLKPPKDLGKDRRFNPISIAPTLPSTLTRFSSTLVFGYRCQASHLFMARCLVARHLLPHLRLRAPRLLSVPPPTLGMLIRGVEVSFPSVQALQGAGCSNSVAFSFPLPVFGEE